MSHGGGDRGGSEKGLKIATYYLNGPLLGSPFILLLLMQNENCEQKLSNVNKRKIERANMLISGREQHLNSKYKFQVCSVKIEQLFQVNSVVLKMPSKITDQIQY